MNPIYKFELNRESVNLVDPSAIIAGRILDPGNGAFNVDSDYQTTENKIAVTPGTTYAIKDKDNNAFVVPVVVFYEPDGSYSYGSTNVSQVTIPNDGIGYIRFSFPITVNARNISFAPSNQSYTPYLGPIAYPIYKDDLAKDFEKESNQEFFRAKLSGKLTFQSLDYDFIVAQPFDFQFVLEIFISYNAGQTWTEYWRGTFWKTDCEFDGDAETVVVQPTVLDQYNDVLAGMDNEYNLIDLAPEIVPVKADKRPMIQVYVPGQSVIGCFLSGMWWEQDCEAESDETKLVNDFKFALNKSYLVADVSGVTNPQLPSLFGGEIVGSKFLPGQSGNQDFRNGNYILRYTFTAGQGGWTVRWAILRSMDESGLWEYSQSSAGGSVPTLPLNITLSPVSGSGVTGNVNLFIHEMPVYSRFVCDTQDINGSPTSPIPADDIVENNRNYRRVISYYFPDTIYFSDALTETPTQWGLYQPGQYYQQPYLYWSPELFPVARNAWGRVSIWFTFSALDLTVEESGREPFTIRHAYPLASVISVLLARIAPGITHEATTDYSQFLYGTNLIDITQTLLITPKSNIVTAGYDQPAQKAPITLKNVTDMLRDCFRCYWFIDDQNRFRVEHIQYFRNGGSYYDSPVVGVDLTTQQVPRNGKAWAFARDQYKFDKPVMAARYQFGWMDDVTQLFEGFPIDIISKYVNPDNIEQIDVSRFTSDIDYILLNPGAVSKDGFVLLAAVFQKYGKNLFVASTVEGGKYIASDGTYGNNADFCVTDFIPITNNGLYVIGTNIRWGAAGYFNYYDENKTLLGTILGTTVITNDGSGFIIANQLNASYVKLSIGGYASIQSNWTVAPYVNGYKLPYYNYVIDSNDHYLQNAYVAFCILQQYYAFDMPARHYSINNVQFYAQGIKKLKNQTIRFPLFNDPDLVQLVKTNLGNGTIEKLSVNLSSRNANATLKYDTE